ncbi:hypothetical protein LZK98_11775 [Sphingomonas cannabina]|uniref:hypothetical protein n=1 Tax=Sphingomonas cannabina TaxID=2899123 RepID=UPI001F2064C8|nr:hypothetical protein [Sphingomonas cannabina]UIJ43770.1 hypothetical protein LZK98_11775 [Sphingomonas cannabina]
MSNMSVLWQNTCLGLSEGAQAIYLRGAARDERKSFNMACLWQDRVEPILPRAIERAYAIIRKSGIVGTNPNVEADVLEFIRERHFRRFFPDGRAA